MRSAWRSAEAHTAWILTSYSTGLVSVFGCDCDPCPGISARLDKGPLLILHATGPFPQRDAPRLQDLSAHLARRLVAKPFRQALLS
jgi:hypothetical protein